MVHEVERAMPPLGLEADDHVLGAGDAIARSVLAADSIGVRAILVHALDPDAASFYSYFEFVPSPTDPLHLLLLMKDARALLGH